MSGLRVVLFALLLLVYLVTSKRDGDGLTKVVKNKRAVTAIGRKMMRSVHRSGGCPTRCPDKDECCSGSKCFNLFGRNVCVKIPTSQ
uniref:Conotoxin n=1 Tax=Conus andremenezi TaxID=1077466 RepID=A0A291C228_9COND|nr:conotoxin [Conus andremenezi]